MQRVPRECCDVVLELYFFQAEDGIRDIGVTGVQTCALPIFVERVSKGKFDAALNVWRTDPSPAGLRQSWGTPRGDDVGARSEERRVGEECRSRWSPNH